MTAADVLALADEIEDEKVAQKIRDLAGYIADLNDQNKGLRELNKWLWETFNAE